MKKVKKVVIPNDNKKTVGLYGSEQDDEDYPERSGDEYFSSNRGSDSEGGVKKGPRIILFCKHTHYSVVKEAGKVFCEYHLTKKRKSDWDIAWFDHPPKFEFLKNMQFH